MERVELMNEWGWVGCISNRSTIADWLAEEAENRGHKIGRRKLIGLFRSAAREARDFYKLQQDPEAYMAFKMKSAQEAYEARKGVAANARAGCCSGSQEKPDGNQENQARILCHILDRQEAQQETEIEEGCDEAARSSRDK